MKDITDKCKEQPKLFYRYVNDKLKQREDVSKLKVNVEVYDDKKVMVEMMNNCFNENFLRKSEFHVQEKVELNGIYL